MKKQFITILIIILLFSFIPAFSPDEAITLATKTNNFLMTNEVPVILNPIVTIEYLKNDYWIVCGMNGTTTSVYIPINTNTKEIANGPIEIRELIQTMIILNRTQEIKNTFPVGDWPFSITNKTNFETMQTKFSEKITSIITIETDFKNIANSTDILKEARIVKQYLEKLSNHSKTIFELIEEGINFEKTFFMNPKTNQITIYENLFSDYYKELNDYKQEFDTLKNSVTNLRTNIGALQSTEITANQKEFYNNIAKIPNETAALNNIFSRANDTQEFTTRIFNSTKNIENFVLNLETRKTRNNAWKVIYGTDNDLKKINPAINSLQEAAETILDEKNVGYWKNQDSINALKVNWRQAQEKYNNGVYITAIEFAKSAKTNSTNILKDGFNEEENIVPTDLITNIIIGLIILIIGIFLFEKFYLNKKKIENGDEGYEDDY
ncbi:MAG: hypothetical protein PHX27_04325 [Candidatus ainarchaeum sp.]|nr:hypothetical protein [Candidatus ainarchaeum sp.]